MAMTTDIPVLRSRLRWPGFLLGLALGGFFDGILLHQILQWHHLLSNVEAMRDMRLQLMADGLFHALMYLVAAIAIAGLWRRREALAWPGAGRMLGGLALSGFGAWHIADGLFSHWITGIHRIRMDSPDPLMWDLIWFFAFGVLPAALGWVVLRGTGDGGDGRGRAAAVSLAMAAIVCGPLAALPAGQGDQVMVLFAPNVSAPAAMGALAEADARVVWVDRSGGLWAVRLKAGGDAWRLYRHGALWVSNAPVGFGCLSWTKSAPLGRS